MNERSERLREAQSVKRVNTQTILVLSNLKSHLSNLFLLYHKQQNFGILYAMKNCVLLLSLLATLCLTGCFTVYKAPQKCAGGEHVVMNNYGWKLFNWIPLFCGNASEDATIGFAIFRDDVTFEKINKRFVGYAGARTIDYASWDHKDTVFFSVFGIPIPYVITYKEISISGVMK